MLDLCLAGNVGDVLDEVTGFVGYFLVPESDDSSKDVSTELSEDDKDEESDEISIYLCAIQTRSYSFSHSTTGF